VKFNCCEDLGLSVVNRYLSGMIQSGSWGLFTDATKMNMGLFRICVQYLNKLSVFQQFKLYCLFSVITIIL